MHALRRRRDRGFSLIVVFMLMIVMVGIAATVVLSSQQDLSVAGQERESTQAFYAAEYAIAQAKDYLQTQTKISIPNLQGAFSPPGAGVTGWTALLQAVNAGGVPQGCKTWSPTMPASSIAPNMNWQDYTTTAFYVGDPNRRVAWRFCIHNNAADEAYMSPSFYSSPPPTGCGTIPPDSCDWLDGAHYITVEAWGAFPVDGTANPMQPLPGAAVVHLAVNIGQPGNRTQLSINSGYSQEGGSGSHDNNGGAIDTTMINTGVIR